MSMSVNKTVEEEYFDSDLLSFDERVERFLLLFSKEHPDIREKLVNLLPAYNRLLSLKATSFEELGLKNIAKQLGVTVEGANFYKSFIPPCIKCKVNTNVYKEKENTFYCRKCKKKFTPNDKSISSQTHKPAIVWMQVLICLLEGYTQHRTCKICNIDYNAFALIRNKLFYAMEILLEDIKLYGEIQCDNTINRTSYKGMTLPEEMFSADTVFDDPNYVQRPAKNRGGPNNKKTENLNSDCIFTLIDDYGHIVTRFVCIGKATATKLSKAVPPSKFLLDVPNKDPFSLTYKSPPKHDRKALSQPSPITVLVSDDEKAIAKYASSFGIEHEHRVFYKKGVYLSLPKGARNIQRVNSLQRRLKKFLASRNYVSSRYLPGYLTLFEFIENTGATDEAIERLFEIIVTPGLGHPAGFYKEKYSVPKYCFEWQENDPRLSNLSYNQILAVYYYHCLKLHQKDKEISAMTMNEILEETGYRSASSIRRLYDHLVKSKAIDVIYNHMRKKPTKKPKKKSTKKHTPRSIRKTFKPDPFAYMVYDECCKILKTSPEKFKSKIQIAREIEQKTGKTMPRQTMDTHLKLIERYNIHPEKLSDLISASTELRANCRKQLEKGKEDDVSLALFKEYREFWHEHKLSVTSENEIIQLFISNRPGNKRTLINRIQRGRQIARKLENNNS